ncbi:helix-turn-helix transcriptional regulator [Pirellulimonas nuda]|nr:helix-turn-helix domain-containing protein [Pirellulimonas nuda]
MATALEELIAELRGVAERSRASLLDADDFAIELRCSTREIRRMDQAGLVPRPLRLGSKVRWRRDEVENWLRAGAPARPEWETLTAQKYGRPGGRP